MVKEEDRILYQFIASQIQLAHLQQSYQDVVDKVRDQVDRRRAVLRGLISQHHQHAMMYESVRAETRSIRDAIEATRLQRRSFKRQTRRAVLDMESLDIELQKAELNRDRDRLMSEVQSERWRLSGSPPTTPRLQTIILKDDNPVDAETVDASSPANIATKEYDDDGDFCLEDEKQIHCWMISAIEVVDEILRQLGVKQYQESRALSSVKDAAETLRLLLTELDNNLSIHAPRLANRRNTLNICSTQTSDIEMKK